MSNEDISQLDKSNELDTEADEFYNSNKLLLNEEQKEILSELHECVSNKSGGFYRIDAPVGSGKTIFIKQSYHLSKRK